MHRIRTSFIGLGLSFAAFAGIAGCKAAEEEKNNAPLLSGSCDPGGDCVDHNDLTHCALGDAHVELLDDKMLEVSEMRDASRDGLSISLPEITNFTPNGRFESDAESTLTSRAFSDGAVISTMSTVKTEHGITLAASFTGNGDASTYSATFTRRGEVVAHFPNISNGADVPTSVDYYCFPPECPPFVPWTGPHSFHNQHQATATSVAGSCSWGVSFDDEEHEPLKILLDDGTLAEVDHVQLLEESSGKGSYSYMSFNRIDYTADGGKLFIGEEDAR